MFQSRRFWFSYRLRVVGEEAEAEDEEPEVIIEFVLVVVVIITMLFVSRFVQEFTSC